MLLPALPGIVLKANKLSEVQSESMWSVETIPLLLLQQAFIFFSVS